MAFLYVDRIVEYVPGKRIRGLKNVTRTEPFLYAGDAGRNAAGQKLVQPPMLVEAFAQMTAWLSILDHQFTKRPLFLGEEEASFPHPAASGDQIEMTVDLIRYNDDVVETCGTASVRGQAVFTSGCGRGFLVPMTDYDDPQAVAKRYAELYRPDLKPGPAVNALPDPSQAPLWRLSHRRPLELVDGVLHLEPLVAVETLKNVTATETYFLEHFPRQPIVPGVIILGMILDACEMLVRTAPESIGHRRLLTLERLTHARFRKPVTPGDRCLVKVVTKSWDPASRRLTVSAVVWANGQRVTQVDLQLAAQGNLPAEQPGGRRQDAVPV